MRLMPIISAILAVAACQSPAIESPATQPSVPAAPAVSAAKPAPATFSVSGKISLSAGWDLQKPDLTRAVIYVASDPALPPAPAQLPRATMGQRDKTFIPGFIVVPIGTEVEFPNWDHISHNVFSRSKAAPAFDLERYPYGWSKTRTFDKVGVVQVFCNIHQQMHAVIVVTPNAFFTRPDADGRFAIKDVPPGHHELVIWHERCEEKRVGFDVTSTGTGDLFITLEQSRGSIIANDPPEHRAGYGVERGIGVKRERLDLPVVKDAHPSTTAEPGR